MTPLELYEIIVGEGGCPPEYFLFRMQWWEVVPFINGVRRRYRPLYEISRWHGWLVSRMLGSKIDEPDDMVVFPWEQEQYNEEQQAEELQALLDRCRRHNQNAKG